MAKSQKESSKRLISRVTKAQHFLNCSTQELFMTAGRESGVSDADILNAFGKYELGRKTTAIVDPPGWFREFINRVRRQKRKGHQAQQNAVRQSRREQSRAAYA